jgi:hypothetical protein
MSDFVKIKFLFAGNFEVEGKDLHFEKDATFDAPAADAQRLVDGKCAEYVELEQIEVTTYTDTEPQFIEVPKISKRTKTVPKDGE